MTNDDRIIENWYCNSLTSFVYKNYEDFQKSTGCSDELLSILVLKHGPCVFFTEIKYKYHTFYDPGEKHEN